MEYTKKNFKLFLISGKARSGKNVVSNIIKTYYKDKKTIIISFGYYIKDYAKRVSDWDGNESTKPRTLLQNLGIELIKNKIDNKLFIRRILEDIQVFSYYYDIIIVNDVRLIDEATILKEKYPSSVLIRIDRRLDNGLSLDEKNHITETELDSYNGFDYKIKNDNNLKNNIYKILSEVEHE